MQCDAVWNLNEAERRWVCHQGMARGRRVGAWGAGEGASGLIRMRLTMAEARKPVNAAAQGERDRDRGLGARCGGGVWQAAQRFIAAGRGGGGGGPPVFP